MKYLQTKKALMFAYPGLFPTEEDVLHHLFFVNGNGFEWVRGELTDGSRSAREVVDTARRSARIHCKEQIRSNPDSAYWKELLERLDVHHYDVKKERQRELEQRRWYVENGFGERCWFLREDGSIGIVLYPMCRFAKILHIPNNVKPDWLKAAVRALEVAETFQVTRIDLDG